jgi:hypothetical protein
MSHFIKNASDLINGMIFSPILELNKVKKGIIPKNIIYKIFIITMLITLAKVPFRKLDRSFDWFHTQFLNEIFIFLNNPFVTWAVGYLLYFWGLFLILKICKIFLTHSDCDDLPTLVMSVSAIGIVAQGLFLPLNYIFPIKLLRILSIIIHLWNYVLISLALKVGSSLPFFKIIIILLIAMIIYTLSTFGWSFMDPYLFFLF